MLIYFVSSFGSDHFKLIDFFLVSATITAIYKSVKFMRNREAMRSFMTNYLNREWENMQDLREKEIIETFSSKLRCV